MTLAPFPYFGGKSAIAAQVWQRLGDVPNYVEPFAGSLAVLLARPHAPHTETVNDADGFISNFWRAVAADAATVAQYADWPVNENDLHARHAWLIGQRDSLTARLEGDPAFYDAKIAGWWVWGACAWIGSGWCSGDGPWQVVNGELVRGNAGQGINRQVPHLGNAGQGINRQVPYLNERNGGNSAASRLHNGTLYAYFAALQTRLRRVRVASGDWRRVLGPSVTERHGLTAIFLDPPYDGHEWLYTAQTSVATDVRDWAMAQGANPLLRIALCGYDTFTMPDGWTCVRWKARGGYGSQGQGSGRANAGRECVWYSPHCMRDTLPLFAFDQAVQP